ncbi:MAG: tRNA-uridine aminocarboxypropyltransferase [Rubripirellula sp.]
MTKSQGNSLSVQRQTLDQDAKERLTTTSDRCWSCFRPQASCFCDMVRTVPNRTSVLILQHRRERFHPFNTARMVHQWLERCELIAGHNKELAKQFDSISLTEDVGLLFPGDDARLLTELSPSERPGQLVIPDGTWHHVKTLMRDVPRLQTLPRYRLAPTSPGRYRIRREPNLQALSTLEATVAALETLEPETVGFHRLTQAFDRMVTDQLEKRNTNSPAANWRRNERRRSGMPNVPRVLSGDLSNIVVAYGERELVDRDATSRSNVDKPAPLYWTAFRLGSGEAFKCAIQSDSFRSDRLRQHLRVPESEIRDSVSRDEFRERWHQFLRPKDRIVVFHNSTAVLLENVHAKFTPNLVLKSVNLAQARSMMESVGDPDVIPASLRNGSRASQRLANLAALVEYLNQNYDGDSPAHDSD